MSNYYDWNKALSYNKEMTFVVGPNGTGKTFGLRKFSRYLERDEKNGKRNNGSSTHEQAH